MTGKTIARIQRREFLKAAGAVSVVGLSNRTFAEQGGGVSILVDGNDPIASGAPVKRAIDRLQSALTAKGVSCTLAQSVEQARGSTICVVVAASGATLAKEFPQPSSEITEVENVRLAPGHLQGSPATLVSGIDQLGLIYGILELAERVQFGTRPAEQLRLTEAVEEKPANKVRCVSRYFCSELEDKSWYYDKDFWREYLDALVAARFNRFCFAYGLEYDFPRGVTDDYFHLPYPYLFQVPGYEGVRVVQLADPEGKVLPTPVPLSKEEQQRNFEMLRFIASETGARGLHFQLGIWTHAYQWTDSPRAYHNIEGLTPETHASYCRDALAIILKECPEIQGLTMRVHGESGIPEGSYPFWKTLFEAIANAGREVNIDMHAKGVNQTMIDIGVATGMPVTLGAKYSAEHQSLGYNQADIRALEIPNPNRKDTGLFSLSGGSRLFTRYGYGDFFQEGSKAKILYRLWPGTQRHLLSADPEMAAAYGRTSHFCGAVGIDLMEPLTFKGREGTGHPGGRCAYADSSLNPDADWQKYEYYYRVWGRKLYNPESDLAASRRYLRSSVGNAAEPIEVALASSSRILPLITSAHLPSASNHDFWGELSTNMPIVLGSERSPYGDTPVPKVLGTVSPLDPQLFSTIVQHAQDLLAARPNPKYSPVEVAQWIEDLTSASDMALGEARSKTGSNAPVEFRRMEEDILIMNGIGRYFAGKFRSGVLYEMFQQTGDMRAGKLAVDQYKSARDAWAKMADRAKGVYVADVSYGSTPVRRGHWGDRVAGIDVDVTAMEEKLKSPPAPTGSAANVEAAISAAVGKPTRRSPNCTHDAPRSFHPGAPLNLSLRVSGNSVSAKLYYRHVNQGERWLSAEMEGGNGNYRAAIPGEYTQSVYPLQYYFELVHDSETATLYPGFNSTLSNQPYYAISQRTI